MSVLCIWGKTRDDVLTGYELLAKRDDAPERVTWRLADSFVEPVGDVCLAVNCGDIEDAYRDADLEVLGDEPFDHFDEDQAEDDGE